MGLQRLCPRRHFGYREVDILSYDAHVLSAVSVFTDLLLLLTGVYITGDQYITAHSGYTWAFNWTEGTLENGFSESQISFFLFNESSGNNPAITAGTQFDLPIIGRDRRISSYYGRPTNFDGFTIRAVLNSSSVTVTPVPFLSTQVFAQIVSMQNDVIFSRHA